MNHNSDFAQQAGYEPQREGLSGQPAATGTRIIPVVEEELQVGKKVVETGRVRVTKQVHEEEVTVAVPLITEQVEVERVTVNQYVETAPQVRYEGDTMVVPVVREEVVVTKRLMLVEELRLTKRQQQHETAQQVVLRKEQVNVDRISSDPNASNPI